MNIALFGGTFDPIHRGHVVVARAAAAKFKLKQVWFVPADLPPHKLKTPVTSFYHRYAMVALALAGEKDFVPSLLEAPDPDADSRKRKPSYSIETVRRVKASLGKSDHLYFLIGMDAFKDIAKWYKAGELLAQCDFIVAARPGYSLTDIVNSLPAGLNSSQLTDPRCPGMGAPSLPSPSTKAMKPLLRPTMARVRVGCAAMLTTCPGMSILSSFFGCCLHRYLRCRHSQSRR